MQKNKRPSQHTINANRRERKTLQAKLLARQKAEGLKPKVKSTNPNRKSKYETVEEENEERMDAVTEQIHLFKSKLPVLLRRLLEIKDHRNPKKIKHKLTVLIVFGIFMFIHQIASRREATRELTKPGFLKHLKLLFPEIESLPHNDTLMRLLSKIEVEKIQETHIELIKSFIRNKKFKRYLIYKCYPIAIDGTQKFARNWLWSEECLERRINKNEKQYYVYTLEATIAFQDGMTIPLMTEFLDYKEGDIAKTKQDCELKAFYRLADRIKKEFPKLRMMILLDGLYANGPVINTCRKNRWQFMIVLKDKCLKCAWEKFDLPNKTEDDSNELYQTWGKREQHFVWKNKIEYSYDKKERKREIINIVVCNETWEEIDSKTNETITKEAKHAWISSESLTKENVHKRCNLGARYRWGIETGLLIEKRHGYNYEHCFTYNWNAMKGFHYLMHLGVLFNVLLMHTKRLAEIISTFGLKGFIRFVRETISVSSLDMELLTRRISGPYRLCLV